MPEFEPVRGLEDLTRAFALAKSDTRKSLPVILRNTARPVEHAAEANAIAIRTGVPWAQMRTGSTTHSVYVAPRQHGTKIVSRKRPRFAVRLLERAMIPALNANRENVGREFDRILARIERQFNRG